jgi:hypothetical protein
VRLRRVSHCVLVDRERSSATQAPPACSSYFGGLGRWLAASCSGFFSTRSHRFAIGAVDRYPGMEVNSYCTYHGSSAEQTSTARRGKGASGMSDVTSSTPVRVVTITRDIAAAEAFRAGVLQADNVALASHQVDSQASASPDAWRETCRGRIRRSRSATMCRHEQAPWGPVSLPVAGGITRGTSSGPRCAFSCASSALAILKRTC